MSNLSDLPGRDSTAYLSQARPAADYADSRTTRCATRVSAVGVRTESTRAVIIGSNEGQSPRLDWTKSPLSFVAVGFFSCRLSNGITYFLRYIGSHG